VIMSLGFRQTTLAAVLAASFFCGTAFAQAPKPAQIDKNGALILIRSSLLALDQANKTGNYTVLRDLGAPGFQAGNNAARLAEIFANLRRDNLDLSGVAVLEPQLTQLPVVDANGMMRLIGFFPSVPTQIKFELLFAPADNQWKLYGVAVSTGQATPTPPPAAENKPAPAGPAPKPKPAPRAPAPKPAPKPAPNPE
jgi:hypothetical protein